MIKIPTKQDYTRFMKEFTNELSEQLPNICFYTYGSINNGTCDYGRSDIDGGLILDSGIVTPKNKILELSKLFSKALNNRGIETQFNLLDRETCRDGRFLSYTEDYTAWLKDVGKVHCGPSYLKEMNGRDFKSGVLHSASFNFSGPKSVRNTALKSLVYLNEDKDKFVEKILSALDKVVKFPKKLIWLKEEKIIPSRTEAKKRLEKILEDVDLTMIDRIDKLFKKPKQLYSKLESVTDSLDLLLDSLGCMEAMVESYIKHFPKISERELKE